MYSKMHFDLNRYIRLCFWLSLKPCAAVGLVRESETNFISNLVVLGLCIWLLFMFQMRYTDILFTEQEASTVLQISVGARGVGIGGGGVGGGDLFGHQSLRFSEPASKIRVLNGLPYSWLAVRIV